jgi:hypothetical protein
MGVEIKRVGMLDPGHEVPELGAYKGGTWIKPNGQNKY